MTICNVFLLDATIVNEYFPTFFDYCNSWCKRWLLTMFCPSLVHTWTTKIAENMNYYFFAKTSVQPLFSDVFLKCFYMIKPSLTTISDFFSILNSLTQLFPDYCNSRCKRWSSTILRPGLHRLHGNIDFNNFVLLFLFLQLLNIYSNTD